MREIKIQKAGNEYFIEPRKKECKEYTNTHDIFIESVLKSPHSHFLGRINKICPHKKENNNNSLKIEYITYNEAYSAIIQISNQMKSLSDFNENKELIGIFMQNRIEWILIEQSIYRNNAITVPLYSTLGLNALKHILEETELKILYISNIDELKLIVNVLKSSNKIYLKIIISVENLEAEDEIEYLNTKFIKIFKIIDFNKKNNALPKIENLCKLNKLDIATICYTSGTSGLPKGAMITHDNIISIIEPISIKDNGFFNLNSNSIYFSYLPLAHMMERIVIYCFISVGSKIIFYRNKTTLSEDIKISQPTFLVTVPRVLEIFKSKILEKIENSSFFKKKIFWFVFRLKKSFGINSFNFVFKQIREAFGGSIIQILCGSAPLNKELKEFMSVVLNIKIQEGYGCTEGNASNICEYIFSKSIKEKGYSSVGVPFYSNRIKIINENGDFTERGILFLKGRNIFKGYYKQPEMTNKVLKDGWFETGDLVELNKNGTIKIIGRNNDTFKIPHGEFIVPEKIETFFNQIFPDFFVTGNSRKNFLVCVIHSYMSEDESQEKFDDFAYKLVVSNYLTKIEIPRFIIFSEKTFLELELLTPTGKLKRKEIEKAFKSQIDKVLNVE